MFACFYIPDFPVQAALLPEPPETRAALRTSPFAILDGPASLPRILATNLAARRAGIQTSMTKLQVETYGGVLLRKRSIAEEESAQNTLVNFAGTFSPRVESTCPGHGDSGSGWNRKAAGTMAKCHAQHDRAGG